MYEKSSIINTNLSDDSLELVVTEKTLGKLITNAQQIHDMVKESLPKYDVTNYNDDNIEQAKKDKAALNKAAKALNDKRIELEGEFNKPFLEFKAVISDICNLLVNLFLNLVHRHSLVKPTLVKYLIKSNRRLHRRIQGTYIFILLLDALIIVILDYFVNLITT